MDLATIPTIILTPIGILGAFIFFLHNRLAVEIKENRTDIKALDTKLSKEIADLKLGLTRIENRIEFSGKVVYIKPEKKDAEEN